MWGQNCFLTNGSYTMTMCPHRQHFLSSSWQKYQPRITGTNHLFNTSRSVWLHPLPHHEERSQGITFQKCGKDSEGYKGRSKQLAGEWLLKVFWHLETNAGIHVQLQNWITLKETTAFRNTILIQHCLWAQSHYFIVRPRIRTFQNKEIKLP
jgi:hypothetical protein